MHSMHKSHPALAIVVSKNLRKRTVCAEPGRGRNPWVAVGRFGSINYLTKLFPSPRVPFSSPSRTSPPSSSRCSASVFSSEAAPARSVYVSIPCTTHPLSAFLLLRVRFPRLPLLFSSPSLKFHRERENRNFDRTQHCPRLSCHPPPPTRAGSVLVQQIPT